MINRREVIALGGYLTGVKSYNELLAKGCFYYYHSTRRNKCDDAINNMKKHYDIGTNTLDTADVCGPSELIMGKFMKDVTTRKKDVVPCTKFSCFRCLDEIDRNEVRARTLKVSIKILYLFYVHALIHLTQH